MMFGRPRFSKYMICFDITMEKICAHFLAMTGPFEVACKLHKQKLIEFYTLLVYTKCRYYPEDIIASDEILSKASPKDQQNPRYVHKVFMNRLRNLEAELVESEKRNHIGRLAHSDKRCLEWFNSQYCADYNLWGSLKSMRRCFKSVNREFLIDQFISFAKMFRRMVYDPMMEDLYSTTATYFTLHRYGTERKLKRENPKWKMPA